MLAHSTGNLQDFGMTPVSPYAVSHLHGTRELLSGISATESRPNACKWARAQAVRQRQEVLLATCQRNQTVALPHSRALPAESGTCCQGALVVDSGWSEHRLATL